MRSQSWGADLIPLFSVIELGFRLIFFLELHHVNITCDIDMPTIVRATSSSGRAVSYMLGMRETSIVSRQIRWNSTQPNASGGKPVSPHVYTIDHKEMDEADCSRSDSIRPSRDR